MENNEQNEENLQDWLTPAMIFAKALGLILEDEQGIVVDLNEQTKLPGMEEIDKAIVFKRDNQIHISPCDEDIEEGNTVTLKSEN